MIENLAEQYLRICNVMLVVLDEKSNIMFLNKAAEEILSCRFEDVKLSNWIENFIPEEQKKELKDVARRVVSNKDYPEYFENYVIDKNGHKHLIAWRNASLKDKNGNVIGTISAGEDITEKRENEKKIKYHIETIEGLNKLMIGRENKMIELKQRISELEEEVKILRKGK